ncbi:MAG: hypothetical protein GVY18_10850 [Bacteroidetes bacterium]|jgi:hypothetical protein|nr:hypothetical protein [Bacteroidota bacterium]
MLSISRFFDTLQHTWDLMGSAWDVLRDTPSLILFPILSGLACGGVLIVGYSFGNESIQLFLDRPGDMGVLDYAVLFVLLFGLYFVGTFFNVALIGTAVLHMIGQPVTVGEGFRIAGRRVPQIAGWAVMQAAVGVLLQVLEDRSGSKGGRMIADLAGVAWSIVTFMVVPVLVVEHRGPVDALKESAKILKETWGRQLAGNMSFAAVEGVLIFVLGGAVVLLGVLIGGMAAIVTSLVVAGILAVMILIVVTALRSIFQGALYLYARHGRHISAFTRRELVDAFSGHGGTGGVPMEEMQVDSSLDPVEQQAWREKVAHYRAEEEQRRAQRRDEWPGGDNLL